MEAAEKTKASECVILLYPNSLESEHIEVIMRTLDSANIGGIIIFSNITDKWKLLYPEVKKSSNRKIIKMLKKLLRRF